MPFSINIYDRNDLTANTQLETGERGSINRSWLGSKDKLEKILGCELAFNMEVKNFQDGFFAHLNTSDERRYWVVLIDEETGNYLWQGHMLPDTYDEPYKVGSFFVKFVATCGLGTLKNQYLPNDFYQQEKSKTEILAEILKLTGLELDIYISPALSNRSKPYWHQNFLETSQFLDGDKKDDAYTVLEKVLGLCRILQDDNAWYVEGVNKLQNPNMSYARYDKDGDFLEDVAVIKSPLNKTGGDKFFTTPRILSNVPVKTITAFHELDESNIPEAVYKVPNKGYVINSTTPLTNRYWTYTDRGYTAKFNPKDGKTFLAPAGDLTDSITIRKEILLSAGDKVEWNIACTNYWDGTSQQGKTVEEIVLDGDWLKLLPYEIYYTNPATSTEEILYSNISGPNNNDLRYQLSFGTDRKAELTIQMIAPATAYYNIRFYQPQVVTGAKVTGIYLDKLAANNISAEEEQQYQDTITETYTKVIERELDTHDDMRQLRRLVRLNKLVEQGQQYDVLNLNSLQVLNTADGDFILLPLESLLAALAHTDGITVEGNTLVVLGAVFNYLGSTEMYLQYDAAASGITVQDGDAMQITLRKFAPVPSDIAEWQLWADDFYKVSYKRLGQAYVEVVRNLYKKPHPVLTGKCKGFVGPRDLVLFNYQGDKVWYVLDCEQHLDSYETTLILSQNFYGEAVTENLPPVVDAGPDQTLDTGETEVTLNATANDPDGTIVAILWEVVSAPDTVLINTPNQLATTISGLNANEYEFKITVTDDAGLTASDTVKIGRAVEYTVVLTQTVDVEKSTNAGNQDQWEALDREWYDISIDPPLEADQVARLTIDGTIVLQTPQFIAGAMPSAVFTLGFEYQFFTEGAHQMVTLLRQGDVKTLALQARAYNSAVFGLYPDYANKVYAKVQVDIQAEIIQGASGEFTNVPIQLIVEARK